MLPNEPQVVRVMREHKAQILAREAAKMAEMADEWMKIERALAGSIAALALEIQQMRNIGQPVGRAQTLRMERYKRLLFQVRAEAGKFVAWAEGDLSAYQGELARLGLEHAADAIRAVYLDNGKIGAYFDILNAEAVEAMIGLAGDGAPLRKYLEQAYGAAADGMTNALIEGIAKGIHPTKMAEEMVNGLGLGLQPAMNTARTESLRAYRQASLQQYQASGVVGGYRRLAAHDERVCAGCLFTEGEFYESLDDFAEHNQGRCTPVPVVLGVDTPQWEGGAAWFEKQTEEVQASILGKVRFEAWKNGAKPSEMVKRVKDPTWGEAFIPTPVGEIR